MSHRGSEQKAVACPSEDSSATRREFLTRMRGGAAVALASSAGSFGSPAEAGPPPVGSGRFDASDRVLDSYQNRVEAARDEANIPVPPETTNRDEQNYRNFIGNYHKGLSHNKIGEVDRSAYLALLNAVSQGTAAGFEQIPLGGNTCS